MTSKKHAIGRAALAAAVIGTVTMALPSYAEDRTISADYMLTADETVDGVLTVDAGATVDLNGHKLTVKGLAGDGTITQAYRLDTTVAAPAFVATDAIFWLDASDSSTITLDGANVNSWQSKVGNRTASKNGTAPVYDSTTYGIPTIDFGATGSGKDMSYSNISNIRTVFWVIKIEKDVNAFFLGGANYHFHRGEINDAYAAGHFRQQGMWNGTDEIVPSLDIPNPDRFHVVCAKMSIDSASNSLTKDRNIAGRNGGRQLSELICFSRHLTDEERLAVTEYLQRKWGVAGGELHIDVDENETTVNSTVALTGGLKLVKEGKGAFTASKASQSYFGGTAVEEGSLTLGTETHPLGLGDASQYVTVKTNATLHSNDKARTTTCCYNFYLGGTLDLTSTVAPYNTGREPFGTRLTLLGDAHLTGSNITLGSFVRFTKNKVNLDKKLTVRLNGHTLYYDADYSYAKNLTTEGPGEVAYTSGYTEVNANVDFISSGLSFTGSSHAHLGDQGYSTGNFRYDVSFWKTHRSASPIHVYGRYVAAPIRPWLTLHDGVTIDLSAMSGTWDITGVAAVAGGANREYSEAKGNGNGAVTILDNSTYTIDIGEREVEVGEKLVNWAVKPNDSVAFNFTSGSRTPAERQIALAFRADGIYVKSTLIPYARWDVNAETPGWRFYYPNGTEAVDWDEGITSDVEVRYFSYAEYMGSKNESVSPAAYVIAGNFQIGDGAMDMTTRVDAIDKDAVIDLRGHSLSLSSLRGAGTITDTTTDTSAPGELHIVVSSGELENSGVAFTGNLKVVKDGEGTYVASKIDQSYTGGTLVTNGVLRLGTSQNPLGAGNGTCTVTVGPGATVDIANKASTATCRYNYVIGGTVTLAGDASGWTWDANRAAFSRIELSGDANIIGSNYLFGLGSGTMPLVLNGYTLRVQASYWRCVTSQGGGKIVFTSGVEMNNSINLQTVDVEFEGAATVHLGDAGFSVGGFKYGTATSFGVHRNASQMTVYGRYVASTIRPWTTFATGATLDLSEVTGTWDSDGIAASSGGAHRSFTDPGLVKFADGAEITVALGNRNDVHSVIRSATPYLVTWSTEPSATFTLDEESYKHYRIAKTPQGLKVSPRPGFVIFVK
jgi:autotransporter-associated beta strand protein